MYVSTSELPNFFLFWWPRHLSCVYAWQYLVSCYGIYYLVILFIINSKETFCRQQHSGPVVGIIECPKLQAIKVAIRALDDLPCVTIPSNARDNNYQVWNRQRPLHFLPFVFPLILLTCPGSWLASNSWPNKYAALCCINPMVQWTDFTR
jgi:hypothetical protein